MGFLQSYRGEGAVYGRTLAKTRPTARIAVLFENTDLGKDMSPRSRAGNRRQRPADRRLRELRVHGEPTSPPRSRS